MKFVNWFTRFHTRSIVLNTTTFTYARVLLTQHVILAGPHRVSLSIYQEAQLNLNHIEVARRGYGIEEDAMDPTSRMIKFNLCPQHKFLPGLRTRLRWWSSQWLKTVSDSLIMPDRVSGPILPAASATVMRYDGFTCYETRSKPLASNWYLRESECLDVGVAPKCNFSAGTQPPRVIKHAHFSCFRQRIFSRVTQCGKCCKCVTKRTFQKIGMSILGLVRKKASSRVLLCLESQQNMEKLKVMTEA